MKKIKRNIALKISRMLKKADALQEIKHQPQSTVHKLASDEECTGTITGNIIASGRITNEVLPASDLLDCILGKQKQ